MVSQSSTVLIQGMHNIVLTCSYVYYILYYVYSIYLGEVLEGIIFRQKFILTYHFCLSTQ